MRAISLKLLRERIRNTHPRTKKVQLNTLLGIVMKGGGTFISLLLVPLTINYLTINTYGTWLTISSITTMIALFDIGIGNGLRNKLSEAVAKQDLILSRTYISTSYFIFTILQIAFIILFLIAYRFVNWQSILNTSIQESELRVVILITFLSIAVKLIFDILSYVLYALQQSGLVNLFNLLFNILILLGVYGLAHFTVGSLTYLAIVTSLSPIIILLIGGYFLYRGKLKAYRPSFKLINLSYAKPLLSLGYKFFVIQIAVVILFYTDNLIINKIFGPSEVTIYNVAYRYFNTITILYTIIITPYWSAFSEAYIKKDIEWMKQTYSYLQKIWLFLSILVITMVSFSEKVYSIWLGNSVTVPTLLTMAIGISVVLIAWNNTTVSVINGLGKVKLQLICSVFAAVINIPLAIYLAKEMSLGSVGVILATSISLLPATIIGTIQARKLINGNSHGIWGK